MTYWCARCMEAVEPEYNWTNIQGDESVRDAFCPHCGSVLTLEADICPLCEEYKPKIWCSCPTCRSEIGVGLETISKSFLRRYAPKPIDLWDAIGEVFDFKYDLVYKAKRKEAEK